MKKGNDKLCKNNEKVMTSNEQAMKSNEKPLWNAMKSNEKEMKSNETVMKNPEPLFLFPTTLQFGLKFSKLELLVEYRDSFIEFKRPDSGHDTIETSGTILFGLGLIF